MTQQTIRFGEQEEHYGATVLAACDSPQETTAQPVLEVRNLSIEFSTSESESSRPLSGVSFRIRRQETVGILGESGAGKTTLALALLRLLPPSAKVASGEIVFEGQRLLSLDNEGLRGLRGSKISLVYQDSSVLNPVLRVGDQLVEVLRAHFRWSKARYRERAIGLLADVEFRDTDRIYAAYPHQLSGGQRQRIVIAQALACEPTLIIADEPTASLDPRTATEITGLFLRLKRRLQTSFLLISHDLEPLTQLSDRIMVMYAGRIVEQGLCEDVLERPLHPYTRALLACSLLRSRGDGARAGKQFLPIIPGGPPNFTQIRRGCDFECRCRERMSICCEQVPDEIAASDTRTVRCFRLGG